MVWSIWAWEDHRGKRQWAQPCPPRNLCCPSSDDSIQWKQGRNCLTRSIQTLIQYQPIPDRAARCTDIAWVSESAIGKELRLSKPGYFNWGGFMDRNGKPAKGQFYLCNEGSAGGHSVHGRGCRRSIQSEGAIKPKRLVLVGGLKQAAPCWSPSKVGGMSPLLCEKKMQLPCKHGLDVNHMP